MESSNVSGWSSNGGYHDGLEVNHNSERQQQIPLKKDHANWGSDEKQILEPPEPPKRRILGVSVTTFWIVATILVIVLAGAVGGGLAGGLASQKKSITVSR
jgi:hypothetical protein